MPFSLHLPARPIILIGAMTEKPEQKPKVISFGRSARECAEVIRSLAKESRNVFFSEHACERMEERGIMDTEALGVLRLGHIEGEPRQGEEPGEIVVKMVFAKKRERAIGVVTVILKGREKLLVSTVEWEDER